MREPRPRAFYAVAGDDGEPRVCQALIGSEPEGSIEITQAQAKAISAAVRAREPVKVKTSIPVDAVTREEAAQMAIAAANAAVARFADALAKSTESSDK